MTEILRLRRFGNLTEKSSGWVVCPVTLDEAEIMLYETVLKLEEKGEESGLGADFIAWPGLMVVKR